MTTETIREELLEACELFYRDIYGRLSDQDARLLASCTWVICLAIEPLAIGIFVRLDSGELAPVYRGSRDRIPEQVVELVTRFLDAATLRSNEPRSPLKGRGE